MPTHYQGTPDQILSLDSYVKLSRAADSVTQRINGNLHEHGLTISQFGVLEALYHLGTLSVGQLGEKILKSSGNMTMVVDNLEKRGLVTRRRREDDRRCIEVSLTPKGHTLITNMLPQHVNGVVQTMSALTDEEMKQLGVLCRKLGLAAAGMTERISDNQQEINHD
ncbi:MAG: MarR family winged helix-turn-helix transcriptional regulator [Chloroflexota bacterium]